MVDYSKAISELEHVERQLVGQLDYVRQTIKSLKSGSLSAAANLPTLRTSRKRVSRITKRASAADGGGRRGRPKGRKMSDETRAKMRAAWERRRAQAHDRGVPAADASSPKVQGSREED